MREYITTVTGNIHPANLGIVSMHEHIWCDISPHSGRQDNILNDIDLSVSELKLFRASGGNAIVEVTPIDLGRNVSALRTISELSGVPIISGIAFYDTGTLPGWVHNATIKEIADFLCAALEGGEGGVCPGLIGELASRNDPAADADSYSLAPVEERIFLAAAEAHIRTDAPITTHASIGRPGPAQLRVLRKGGAVMEKVAIGHCDAQWNTDITRDLDYYQSILDTGAYCEFDLAGWEDLMPDRERALRIARMAEKGYASRIILGSDTCRQSQLQANGGRGYGYLLDVFVPLLKEYGVTDDMLNSMLVEAPATFLSRRSDES